MSQYAHSLDCRCAQCGLKGATFSRHPFPRVSNSSSLVLGMGQDDDGSGDDGSDDGSGDGSDDTSDAAAPAAPPAADSPDDSVDLDTLNPPAVTPATSASSSGSSGFSIPSLSLSNLLSSGTQAYQAGSQIAKAVSTVTGAGKSPVATPVAKSAVRASPSRNTTLVIATAAAVGVALLLLMRKK